MTDTDGPAALRHPPTAETNDQTGERWYIHPGTGERFVSVTTVLKALDKPALVPWGAKMGAQALMDNLPLAVKAARRNPCGNTGQQRCGTCRDCVVVAAMGRPFTKSREAADRGSRVHAVIEHHVLTGDIRDHDDEAAPFVASYLAWCADYQPTYLASECTVINRTHGYAGTCDGIIRIGDRTPAIDVKTTDKTTSAFYPEYALQLAPYRWAEAILLPDGTEEPLPATDSAGLLSLRPNGYTFRPIVADESTFATFVHLLSVWHWQNSSGADSVKGSAWPKPTTVAKEPAKRRAAPKKATKIAHPPAARIAAADPLALTNGGRSAGNRLTDADIPF